MYCKCHTYFKDIQSILKADKNIKKVLKFKDLIKCLFESC